MIRIFFFEFSLGFMVMIIGVRIIWCLGALGVGGVNDWSRRVSGGLGSLHGFRVGW